ncbi:GlxA family transcriptional regulator [Paracoccus xiamenensis]|uniref:GlxA family transcriptional regulator n=1 Tax=Paracoccus xiamenensis TaxID=2714901 RepID=UPI001407D20B|nr:GlxA family transcriptional regulator [Paracoccus xiamenensis]NHF72033.1 GlxA family transcriptional regulator [Paracoccus xiamenensis]
MSDDALREIGLLIYPGVQMAAVLGMTDLFETANFVSGAGAARSIRISHWQLAADEDQPTRIFDTVPSAANKPAVVIVPPALGTPISPKVAQRYVPWLKHHHAAGAALGSICTGSFVLGETGLLDNRRITTHWTFDEQMRARFPKVSLDLDQLTVDDGDIITGGGAMSWIDVSLRLVDRLLGTAIMIKTAKALLVDPPHREQRYYSTFAPRLNHGDAAILKVQHWLQKTGAKEADLKRLAEVAGLEGRTFLRRFKKATGLTTTEYFQRIRVSRAQDLLQTGTQSLDQIAWQVGYGDPGAFRKVFTRIIGLSPGDYRKRFRV